MRTLVCAIAVLAAAPTAAQPVPAETAETVRAQGEQLAKDGRLSEAIDAFKRADRLEPRAIHACFIALAYLRRELWPQAEIFLSACHGRSTAMDPLPDWVHLADAQLAERLASAKVAAVTIRVTPDRFASATQLVASSFAPDEQFGPRVIHLAIGTHQITAKHPDRPPVQQTIEITDTTPREVVFDLEPPRRELPPPPPPAPSRTVPWTIVAIGGAITLVGGAYHVFAFKPTRDRLVEATDSTPDPAQYDRYSGQFDTRRGVTIALYGVGAAVMVTGLVLRFTRYAEQDRGPRISAQVAGDGAVVGVEWRR